MAPATLALAATVVFVSLLWPSSPTRTAGRFGLRSKCSAPPSARGPCKASIEAWTYVEGSGSCERLDYGGCGATANFFFTKFECQEECLRDERRRLTRLSLSRCESPPATEDECERSHDAFTVRHAKCRAVPFRGCPTANYFFNREECERECLGGGLLSGYMDVRCGYPPAEGSNLGGIRRKRRRRKRGADGGDGDDEDGGQDDDDFGPAGAANIVACREFLNRGDFSSLRTLNYFESFKECQRACERNTGSAFFPSDPASALCRPQLQMAPPSCVSGLSILAEQVNVTGWTFASGRCRAVSYRGCGMRWKYFAASEECQEVCGDLIQKEVSDKCVSSPTATGGCPDKVTGYMAKGRMVTYFESFDRNGGNGTCVATADLPGCTITNNKFFSVRDCYESCVPVKDNDLMPENLKGVVDKN